MQALLPRGWESPAGQVLHCTWAIYPVPFSRLVIWGYDEAVGSWFHYRMAHRLARALDKAVVQSGVGCERGDRSRKAPGILTDRPKPRCTRRLALVSGSSLFNSA
jgi:hypothetical protein